MTKKIFISFSFSIFFLYSSLILSLLYYFEGGQFLATLFSKRVLFSIYLSLTTATITTILAAILAIPTAYALSRYNYRFKNLIDSSLELPTLVSPAALGAIILIFFTNPLGRWIQDNTVMFVFTFWGIILAQFITVLGVSIRFIKSVFDNIPDRFETVSRTLGASPYQSFTSVTLPLAKQGIISSLILTWAKAMGEFGATMTIAGTMAFKTETLPISIFMHLSVANIQSAVMLIIILLLFGMSALFAARIIFKNKNYA